MESHFERAEAGWSLAAAAAAFVPARPRSALAAVGVVQAKHTESLDSDATIEAQVNDLRGAPGLPASGSRGLSVPGRAWIAIGAAALLWGVVAAVVIFVI